jgi:hypothetical protein
MFWTALGGVLSQALAIAISPIGIAVVVLLLLSAQPLLKGGLFAAGWVTSIFVVTIISYSLAEVVDADTEPEVSNGINILQLAIGLLFIGLAVKAFRSRPAPGEPAKEPALLAKVATMSPMGAFGIAAAIALVNVKTPPLAVSAGAQIGEVPLSTAAGITAVVIFALVASITIVGPLLAVLILGEKSKEPLLDFKVWLIENLTTIVVIVFAILGVNMLGKGLAIFS